ncbi:MAG: 50S ribosomal protein L3 N(5)-glutamine methyltransferase [Xanthomonadales bacterium]|nr:50S ribosomal protein L3 N(5)-glutamine methyltransferase [Xanthomonadales bacterium]
MNAQKTIADWIEAAAGRLQGAGLHFGHGTDNARDEAAWLVLDALGAPLDGRFEAWGQAVDERAAARIEALLQKRIESRKPLAYLTGSAWFAGLAFEVSEDVLVPRSPIAELIADGFRPWLDESRLRRVLDLCTGCGCIAVSIARRFPDAQVDASDISAEALEVAARNARRHGVEERLQLIRSDLFDALPARGYDLIVANPPYVPSTTLAQLPEEYRAEPSLGLVSGPDGLEATLRILVAAPSYLARDGLLVCEVGESEGRLAAALPGFQFLWLEFEHGGYGVFLLTAEQLEQAQANLQALIEERKHVT